jgi:tetratricopeptide (TPR) repeat protein
MTYDDYDEELAGLLHCGKLGELIWRCQQLVEQFQITFGKEHEQTARAVDGLAFAHYEMGNWDTAAAEWAESCQIHLAIFGERSPKYVRSLCDVARADLSAGRIDKAQSLVDQAMAKLPTVAGDQRLILIEIWVLVARLRVRRKDYTMAEDRLLDAVRLRLRQLEGEYGGRHNWIDLVLSDIFACLGWVYAHQGNFKAAKGATLKAIRIRETQLDGIRPYYARMLSSLGEIQGGQRDFAAASASQLAALELLRRIRPEGHFDINWVNRRLATLEAFGKRVAALADADGEGHT